MPLSWDEVDEIREKASRTSARGDTDSITCDDEFHPTKVEDLFQHGSRSPDADERRRLQKLAIRLPQKIAFESQNAKEDLERLGDVEAGFQALEKGLERLDALGAYQEFPPFISAKIQILSDLERYEEARRLLSSLCSRTRSHGSNDDVLIVDQDDPDSWYMENYTKAEHTFELAMKAQDFSRAESLAPRVDSPGQPESASPLAHFKQCRGLFELGMMDESLAPRGSISTTFTRMGDALRHYSKGCDLIEYHRDRSEHPEARITNHDHLICANLFFAAARVCIYFGEHSYQILPTNFQCDSSLTAKDWNHQALDFLERGRSRALLESMIRNETLLPVRQRDLLKVVASAGMEYIIMHRKTPTPERRVSRAAKASVVASDKEMRRLRARMNWKKALLGVLNPTLNSALPAPPGPGKINDIRAKIPADTAIIEYSLVSLVKKGLITLMMTRGGIEVASWTPFEVRDLKVQIEKLRKFMDMDPNNETTKELSTRGRLAKTEALVEDLSNLLIRPFEQLLTSKTKIKKIIFVPSGDLAHIPWALLKLREPLTVTHSVSVIPSLSVWHRLHCRFENSQKPPVSRPNIYVVSNSPTHKGKLRRDNIPFSRIEALHIARTNDKWPILADRDERVTFEREVKYAQVLHLSAHGDFNQNLPMRSKIRLFKDSLTILDLTKLAIKAELVVFSSCLSGFSRAFDSGGAFSFAHALLGTGTRAFVGTLWPVDDAAALLVMVIFYEKLQQGSSPADALQAAQNAMIEMDQAGLDRLVDRVKEVMEKHETRKMLHGFVHNAFYWIDHLKSQDLEKLREPRCWAAFVLTGYGYTPVYRSGQI
jgi:CHAT domain-containing protein